MLRRLEVHRGQHLAQRIKEDRPSFGEAAELVATVAEALHYAHSKGWSIGTSSRATSCSTPSGKPYVADFGLALEGRGFRQGPQVMPARPPT